MHRNSKLQLRGILAASIAHVALLCDVAAPVAQNCTRKYCPDMTDCAEAWRQFHQCGDLDRDADHDGIPCENVCGKTLEVMHQRLRASGIDPASDAWTGPAVAPKPAFSCSPAKTCKVMRSCEEAIFQLVECGHRRLDGDGDGVPCNSLCRNR